MQLFGSSFEVRGLFVFMLSVVSLCVAALVYWSAQSKMQDDLVTAYRKADVVSAFCDNHVAFDREACGKTDKMSWSQVHALLVESGVINMSEFETAFELDEAMTKFEPRQGETAGIASEDEFGWEYYELVEALRQTGGVESALQIIYRLSGEQCVSRQTGITPEDRAKQFTDDLAFLLADAVGGPELLISSRRCERARKRLILLGSREDHSSAPEKPSTIRDPGQGLSGFRFSTARCVSDKQILTALGIKSTAVLSSSVEFAQVREQDGEQLTVAVPIGYDLSNRCTDAGELETGEVHEGDPDLSISTTLKQKRHEAFTEVQQYLLGLTHALPDVREAKKWANAVRGPEHIGILSLGLFVVFTLAIRMVVMRVGVRRVRNGKKSGCLTEQWRELARDLARGGDAADRRVDAVVRGRTLVRWAVATVPAIGFIGTVRGILNALAQAGDVVWAGDRLGRADAIGQLAGELGLAFSTTLFALVVGVLLGLLMALARGHEGRVLDALVDAVDTFSLGMDENGPRRA